MNPRSNTELFALLGLIAGMRTSGPILAVAEDPIWARLAVLGECCVDKLPFVPARTQAGGAFGRMVSSAWAARTLARRKRVPVFGACAIAVTSAIVSTNAMYELRKALGEKLRVPDPVIALLEDALVLRLISVVQGAWGAPTGR